MNLQFWPLVSVTIGSQIGSGVFMLPNQLAPFGWMSLVGWILSGLGALALAFIFGHLSSEYPEVGGPHAYVHKSLGSFWGFLTGWTYWIISWVSTTAVVATAVSYLNVLLGWDHPMGRILLGGGLLFMVTYLNLRGLRLVGYAECILTSIKIIPLVVVPVLAFSLFKWAHLSPIQTHLENPLGSIFKVVTLTMWGFVGLEAGTTPGHQVEDARRNIPKALLMGTGLVALFYWLNSLSLQGSMPAQVMSSSEAPYATVISHLTSIPFLVDGLAILSAIVCIGTLNAWTLTSGQSALGLSEKGYLPPFLGRCNAVGAPVWGITLSSLGIFSLMIVYSQGALSHLIDDIINLAVAAFLYVYILCTISFLVVFKKAPFWKKVIAWSALAFCLTLIISSEWHIIWKSLGFSASGLLYYPFAKKRIKNLYLQEVSN